MRRDQKPDLEHFWMLQTRSGLLFNFCLELYTMSGYEPEQVIFHIDVNSAYLSWSAVRELEYGNPIDLREIPSIVGGDQEKRHGIVLAKSIPAKSYGIVTGEPVAAALRKCPTLTVIGPDHEYYHKKSRQLMEYLLTCGRDIEQVSVDECYMPVTSVCGQYGPPLQAACRFKDGIFKNFGFTVNIGISDKKVLAKMASDFEKPDKVHTLYSWEIEKKLWPLPVSKLYMCGKSSARHFYAYGIRTIGDLAQADPASIELNFKSHGKLLWEYANGMDDTPVITKPAKAKGIGSSTTLSADVVRREDAHKVLERLAESVGRRLRKSGMLAGVVCTEIKYASFRSVSHQQAFQTPVCATGDICRLACRLFDELWDGSAIRLLGSRTSKLTGEDTPVQMTIFDLQDKQEKTKKRRRLDEAVESIRKKYGADALRHGL